MVGSVTAGRRAERPSSGSNRGTSSAAYKSACVQHHCACYNGPHRGFTWACCTAACAGACALPAQACVQSSPSPCLHALQYFNIPIDANFSSPSHPLSVLKTITTPRDIVVVKIDIDTPAIEQKIVEEVGLGNGCSNSVHGCCRICCPLKSSMQRSCAHRLSHCFFCRTASEDLTEAGQFPCRHNNQLGLGVIVLYYICPATSFAIQ